METFTAILTITVAIATIVAGFSVFFQWRLNRYKTKVELYDRTKHFYDSTIKLYAKITSNYLVTWNEAIDYRMTTSSAKFILKGRAKRHIEDVQSKAKDLAYTCMRIEDLRKTNRNEEYAIWLQKKESLIDWFQEQHPVTDKVFKKHLDISF